MDDILEKYPFLKVFPEQVVERSLALFFWPIVVSTITGAKDEVGKPIAGWMISIPMTASQMMKHRVQARKLVQKALLLARKKGASYIGLGAMTASLTRGGLDLVSGSEKGEGITNGKLYTAKNIADITLSSVNAIGLDYSTVVVAIVGAAGSIGSATAQILASAGFKNFILIDLSERTERVATIEKLLKKINHTVHITKYTDLKRLKEADVIITATNRPDALITSEHITPGTIVVDDAQPSDIDPLLFKERDDVLLLEGGAVHSDDIQINIETGLKHKTDIFSCLAEVIILTNIRKPYSLIGEVVEVDFDLLNELLQLSNKLGLKHGGFQNMHKIYTDSDIARIKEARRKYKSVV